MVDSPTPQLADGYSAGGDDVPSSSAVGQSLYDINIGDRAVISGSDLDVAFDQRLRELGLRKGTLVTVVQKAAGGGRVVRVNDARYALDAFTLKHIAVTK